MIDLFDEEEIRALSWKEPFGSLMLYGKIETRVWPTKYRGKVLICTSKTSYKTQQVINISGKDQFRRIMRTLEGQGESLHKYRGYAIAIGDLADCRRMKPEDENNCFVEYHPDLWCHVYANVKKIQPFPWKGSQGWRTLTPEIKSKIIIL